MALVVETGSGLPNAESYISVADADSYFLAYYPVGQPLGWLKETHTAAREVALRKATRYIDSEYGGRFSGLRLSGGQALAWPRFNACDSEGYPISNSTIPKAVKDAVCEAALVLVADTDALDGEISSDSAGISQESFSLGSISESVTYNGTKATTNEYPLVVKVLQSVLVGGGGITLDRS